MKRIEFSQCLLATSFKQRGVAASFEFNNFLLFVIGQ